MHRIGLFVLIMAVEAGIVSCERGILSVGLVRICFARAGEGRVCSCQVWFLTQQKQREVVLYYTFVWGRTRYYRYETAIGTVRIVHKLLVSTKLLWDLGSAAVIFSPVGYTAVDASRGPVGLVACVCLYY